ncbi:hypothetical protein [Streptomyces sp. NPDC002082]|uniref:hypothetical protein n=1 Tax=Streptomyces sp. NPDC002082 TaxID=3154772 RepID=UPI00332CA8F8
MTTQETGESDDVQADPQWFVAQLRRLLIACGAGTASKLAARMKKKPHKYYEERMPHSTISNALSPLRQDLPSSEVTRRFVTCCIEYADDNGFPLTLQDRDIERWLWLLSRVDEEIKEVAHQAAVELVVKWSELIGLDTWKGTFQKCLMPPFGLPFATQDRLGATLRWMIEADWPEQFPKVSNAFKNFRDVLDDLLDFFVHQSFFSSAAEEFYEIRDDSRRYHPGSDKEKFHQAEREYIQNVWFFQGLLQEVNAAANHVCDMVRTELDSSFRAKSGLLTLTHYSDDGIFTRRWTYSADLRGRVHPYGGATALREEVLESVRAAFATDAQIARRQARVVDQPGEQVI